jgi:hypothetical protein
MIMQSTHDEYSGVLLNFGACYMCVIMVDVTQMRCKKCNACGTCECRSLSDCTDISLWKCLNCSCGRRAAWKHQAISHVKRDYPNQRSSENCHPMNWIQTTICRMHILLQMISLDTYVYCTCNYDAPMAWWSGTLRHVVISYISKIKRLRTYGLRCMTFSNFPFYRESQYGKRVREFILSSI